MARPLGIASVGWLPRGKTAPGVAVPWPQTFLVMLVSLALAYAMTAIVFTLSFWLYGVYPEAPQLDQTVTIVDPVSGGLAQQAGIRTGDRIVSLGGDPTDHWPDLTKAVKRHEGKAVAVEIERDGQPMTVRVLLPVPGRLGVRLYTEKEAIGLAGALARGFAQPARVLRAIAKGVFRSISGQQSMELGGPVMVVKETSRQSFGTEKLLMFYGSIMSYMAIPLAFISATFIRLRRPREEDQAPPATEQAEDSSSS